VPRERAEEWLGAAYLAAGDLERAERHLRVAREIAEQRGLPAGTAQVAVGLARALVARRDDRALAEARAIASGAIEATDGVPGSLPWGIDGLLVHAEIDLLQGDAPAALAITTAAGYRRQERDIGLWRLRLEIPYRRALAALAAGDEAQAAAAIIEAANVLRPALDRIEQSELRASFLTVPMHREIQLLASERGHWAHDGRGEPGTRAPRPGGLTKREIEVLQLVAIGKTNRDIADTLFISEKTVARHLTNIFTKIGTESRTQAAAWAYRNSVA
jgi:DNA-binding CsgD family transcriptional regulator